MATIQTNLGSPGSDAGRMGWERYAHAPHYRTAADEFDACKLGFWLFLTTEVLLFAGLFVAYAIFRMLYPDAFAAGSHLLDWRFGFINTVVLLVSSFTVAMAIRNCQKGQYGWSIINLVITIGCALAFLFIKFTFEYGPKWAQGKRPGSLFDYPFSTTPNEPLWWSVYYCATGIHALHVVIGMGLLIWCLVRQLRSRQYGPGHYTMVEMSGLYWHLVDLIWIFLFPLLYLIH